MLRDVHQSTTWRERLSYVLRGPGWAYRNRDEREKRDRRLPRVGRAGELGRIDGDVDRATGGDELLTRMGLGADEQLPAFAAVEAGAHHEGLVDGNRCDVANRQLARERGFAQHPDHKAR